MTGQTTSTDMVISREQLGRWLDRARQIGPAAPRLTHLMLRLADRPCRDALTEAREAACLAARTALWDVQAMAVALATELDAALEDGLIAPSAGAQPRSVREMA
jgi:hypothetical protein